MQITRGFTGKNRPQDQLADRIPPGQHLTADFPVLTAGPTPRTPLDQWSLSLQHGEELLGNWSWQAFAELPQTEIRADIHCVTKWSKLDTNWRGVTIDDLLRAAGREAPPSRFMTAHCDGGYTTNLPMADLAGTKAMVATHFGGLPLEAAHGGPAHRPAKANPCVFVCGPTPMVEQVADDLVSLGHAESRVKTERFGPTGREG